LAPIWLAVVFASYSLFVEPGPVAIAALVALSISIVLFFGRRSRPAFRRVDADPEEAAPRYAGAD
jgi:hypothetical protein